MGCLCCPADPQIDEGQLQNPRPQSNRASTILNSVNSNPSTLISSSSISLNSPSLSNNRRNSQGSRIRSQSSIQQQNRQGEDAGQLLDLNTLFHLYVHLRTAGNRDRQFETQQFIVGFIHFLQLIQGLQNQRRGLTSSQIQSLNHKKATNNDLTCPICQQNIKKDEQIISLNCHHDFHKSCIVEWLERSDSCPMCRRQVQPN